MLYWTAIFVLFALVATAFGLGGIAVMSLGIAQLLLLSFVVLAVLAMANRVFRS